MAIIKTGKSAKSVVQCGLPYAVWSTLDNHVPRTKSDVVYTTVGSSGKRLYSAEESVVVGPVSSLINAYEQSGYPSKGNIKNVDVPEFVRNRPEIVTSARYVISIWTASPITKTEACFLHYVLAKKNREQADLFVFQLVTGSNVRQKMILHLRGKLHMAKAKTIRWRRVEKLKACVKVWNAMRKGKSLTHKSISPSTKSKEKYYFPVVV